MSLQIIRQYLPVPSNCTLAPEPGPWKWTEDFGRHHGKLANLWRALTAFIETQDGIIVRGRWVSWHMHGFWYRETKGGPGWALIWWGEGLVDFVRVRTFVDPPMYESRGPYYPVPERRWGWIRFYRLTALEDLS